MAVSSAAPATLGVKPVCGGVRVAVVSRHAERVFFCLFDGRGEREIARVALDEREGDVHFSTIAGVKTGARYGFRAEGPWDPNHGHRFDSKKLLVDPYAVELDRSFRHAPELSLPPAEAVDTASLVPKAIMSEASPPAARAHLHEPGFIYEISVRAFTKLRPDIPPEQRGTVAALRHPAIIDHLRRLGVDTVELMPLAASIDERHLPRLGLTNAWGYNPVTFIAPDPRLAPGGISEIRDTVAALHEAGIAVILDIVLNHTGESDEFGATLSLRGLDNALYYRHALDNPGRLVNDTGCGNTLALERMPVMRLALDALRHWASLGFDGFRFDLATVLGRTPDGFDSEAPLLSAIESDPILRELTMIAEPWDAGPGGYRLGQFPARWGEWNDRFHQDVRRFWRGDAGTLSALATRLAGSSDIFANRHRRPSRSINYIAAHDGFPVADIVAYASKHNLANGEANRDGSNSNFSWNHGVEGPVLPNSPIAALRARDQRALLATLFLSRGTAMLTAGDEFGRTQKGNNNAYAQDNETTWLDWEKADRDLLDFTRQLAALRKQHAVLHEDRWLTGAPRDPSGIPDVQWLDRSGQPMPAEGWAEGQVLGVLMYGDGARLCVWLNGASERVRVSKPPPRSGYRWEDMPDTLEPHTVSLSFEVTDRSRVALANDDLVGRVAEAAGIQPCWWDVEGRRTEVTPETKRALLKSMGIAAENAADAWDSLHSLMLRKAGPIAADPAFLSPELIRGEKLFGLSAHLYSLRGRRDTGCGDFGTLSEYCELARELSAYAAGINPLHHMFPTDRQRVSPYQPSDRRFIDPLYINVPDMTLASESTYVDYPRVWREKDRRLRQLYRPGPAEEISDSLRLHAIFETIAHIHGGVDRIGWPKAHTDSRAPELAGFAARHAREIGYRIWLQQLARSQLAEAVKHGAPLYCDLALGTAPDGGEVWAAPELFAKSVSIGAPPDPFSADGQVWALAPFHPQVLADLDFTPYREILRANLHDGGLLRIDHVLGFARQFWVPNGAKGAEGAYVTFPLDGLLAAAAEESRAAGAVLIGEDLGTVPEGFRSRLAAANMLSYKVLWFERDDDALKDPRQWPYLAVACLSSHDLPTLRTRLADSAVDRVALEDILREAGLEIGDDDVTLAATAHRLLAMSGAALALIQVDDLAGETEPLNVPGTDREQPNWRRRLSVRLNQLATPPLARAIIAAMSDRRINRY